jgi:L-lysine 2,3-aminomutase
MSVIPQSEKIELKPLYVCPRYSNYTYRNNMIKQMQCSIKQSNISYIMTYRSEKDYINVVKN